MPDHLWKQFERAVAELIGGSRFPANSGHALDCEGPRFVAQCKNVKELSLSRLTELALIAEGQGAQRKKAGIVAVKLRKGAGYSPPTLIVMTDRVFAQMHPAAEATASDVRGFVEREIAKIESDERFHYPPASTDVNAALALIQVEMKARMGALRSLKALLDAEART